MRGAAPHHEKLAAGCGAGHGRLCFRSGRPCGVELRHPVVLHEQNGIAGLTNKWLAKIATTVMSLSGRVPPAEVVGNPVRNDVLALPLPAQRLAHRSGPIRVLVIGGSQGARILNQIVPQVAAELGDAITLWHQTGKGARETVQQAYQAAGQRSTRSPSSSMTWRKPMREPMVVCRSGALTVSEVAAAGLPAIFVPFQHKDRQQYWNALPLEKPARPKFRAAAVYCCRRRHAAPLGSRHAAGDGGKARRWRFLMRPNGWHKRLRASRS